MKALTHLVTGSLLGLLLLATSCHGSTPPVVKLGLLAPFEELYRTDGYAVLPAVQLAINQRNAAGGVAGSQVALVALNDIGRPEEAQRQAANLAVDGDVLGVIGPVHAATGAAAGPVLANQGLPWISLASLAPDQQPSGFALEAQPAQWVQRANDLLRADGVTEPLVVANDGRFLIDPSSPQSPAGVVWLGDAAGGADLAGQLSPDALLVGGPELGSAVFAGRAGSASAGVRWLSAGPASDSLPASFVAAYQELAGAPPSPQAVLAYDAANLLLDAIALAGQDRTPVSRQSVLQAVAELGEAGWQGLSGPVVWQSAGCPAPQPCWLRFDSPLIVHQW